MPPEEKDIDVGDSEESSVSIDLNPEEKPESLEVSQQEDELDEYSTGVQTRIGELTKRFREEERQKQSAIEFAENVRKENENLKKRIEDLDKGYQEQFGNRVDSQLESTKRLLKEAHESNNVDQIVEAQTALSDLTYEKGTLTKLQKETAIKKLNLAVHQHISLIWCPLVYRDIREKVLRFTRRWHHIQDSSDLHITNRYPVSH